MIFLEGTPLLVVSKGNQQEQHDTVFGIPQKSRAHTAGVQSVRLTVGLYFVRRSSPGVLSLFSLGSLQCHARASLVSGFGGSEREYARSEQKGHMFRFLLGMPFAFAKLLLCLS